MRHDVTQIVWGEVYFFLRSRLMDHFGDATIMSSFVFVEVPRKLSFPPKILSARTIDGHRESSTITSIPCISVVVF